MLTGFSFSASKVAPKTIKPRFAVQGDNRTIEFVCGAVNVYGVLRELGGQGDNGFFMSPDGWAAVIGKVLGDSSEHSDGHVVERSPQSLLQRVHEQGLAALRAWAGQYAAVLGIDDAIYVVAAKAPGPSVYVKFTAGQEVQVASEIKAFSRSELRLRREITSEAEIFWKPWQTSFEGIYRVPPGHYVRVSVGSDEAPVLLPYWSPWGTKQETDPQASCSALLEKLERAVDRIQVGELISFISGGLDSSAVTALAKREGRHLRTYSVGTETHNEFSHARKLADHVRSDHTELLVSHEQMLAAFPEVVFSVEHGFSTYLEYLVPGHVGLQQVVKPGDAVLSGYGSDVLFAGFAKPTSTPREISELVNNEYRTTLWSNEASHVLAGVHGAEIFYPFFDSEVVETGLSIAPTLLHRDGWEKWVLRRAVEHLLPPDIAWRRKTGIHQSTGMEGALSVYLSQKRTAQGELRRFKDRFSYKVLELLFIEGLEPHEIEMSSIRDTL